jgi:hypothetical protein
MPVFSATKSVIEIRASILNMSCQLDNRTTMSRIVHHRHLSTRINNIDRYQERLDAPPHTLWVRRPQLR